LPICRGFACIYRPEGRNSRTITALFGTVNDDYAAKDHIRSGLHLSGKPIPSEVFQWVCSMQCSLHVSRIATQTSLLSFGRPHKKG
jgi:hypothetical protein